VALFSPSEALSAPAMVERHQRFGRCRPELAQVERRAVTEEDGRPGAGVGRGVDRALEPERHRALGQAGGAGQHGPPLADESDLSEQDSQQQKEHSEGDGGHLLSETPANF
jgi:hypothetical protein